MAKSYLDDILARQTALGHTVDLPAAPRPVVAPVYGRWLITKYGGDCSVCGDDIPKGTRAHWDDLRTLACAPCGTARQHAAADPEAIRAARQAKLDKRADRLTAKADRLDREAEQKQAEFNRNRQDLAWLTQPANPNKGFGKQRQKAVDRYHAGVGLAVEAHELRQQVEYQQKARVKGDAERRYQAVRDQNDATISKGSRVHDPVFGFGTVVTVYPKSYRIKFDSSNHSGLPWTTSRDKSYVRPLSTEQS